MKAKRILLTEDDPMDVEMTLEALAAGGLAGTVDVANDGVEAMEYLLRQGAYASRPEGNPDLILLDLKMPRLDGLQVLERIKREDRLKTIPVVMLTASRQESDLDESYRLGVNAFVVKPVDIRAYTDAIQVLGRFWTTLNEPPPPDRP